MGPIYVCHGLYGCDTGCCGYRLCWDDEADEEILGTGFTFEHPRDGESAQSFAEREWPRDLPANCRVLPGKWWTCG